MKKRISITIESTQGPMTGEQIVTAISTIQTEVRELLPFNVQPDIQVFGDGGDVHKIRGTYVEDLDL